MSLFIFQVVCTVSFRLWLCSWAVGQWQVCSPCFLKLGSQLREQLWSGTVYPAAESRNRSLWWSRRSHLKLLLSWCKSHLLICHGPHPTEQGVEDTLPLLMGHSREVTCNEQECLILCYRKKQWAVANNETIDHKIFWRFSTELCQKDCCHMT